MPNTRQDDFVTLQLPNGTYDIAVKDIAGQELREGVVLNSGNGYRLLPRAKQRSVSRVDVYAAGVLTEAQKNALGPRVPGNTGTPPTPQRGRATVLGAPDSPAVGPTLFNQTQGKYWALVENYKFGTDSTAVADFRANTIHNFTELSTHFVFRFSSNSSDSNGLVGGDTGNPQWWSTFVDDGTLHEFTPQSLKLKAHVNTTCSAYGTAAGQCNTGTINTAMIRPKRTYRPGLKDGSREPIYVEISAKFPRGQGAWASALFYQRFAQTGYFLGSPDGPPFGNVANVWLEAVVGAGSGQFSGSAEPTKLVARTSSADTCAAAKWTVPYTTPGWHLAPDFWPTGFNMSQGFQTYGVLYKDGGNEVWLGGIGTGTLLKRFTDEWVTGQCGGTVAADADLIISLVAGIAAAPTDQWAAMTTADINNMVFELEYLRVYQQTTIPPVTPSSGTRTAGLDAVLLGGSATSKVALLGALLKKTDRTRTASLGAVLTNQPAASGVVGPNFGAGRNYQNVGFFDDFTYPSFAPGAGGPIYDARDNPRGKWHTGYQNGVDPGRSAFHDDEYGRLRNRTNSPADPFFVQWYNNQDFLIRTVLDAHDSNKPLSCLTIRAKKGNWADEGGTYEWTSGMLSTEFTYLPAPPFYMECKVRVDDGEGVWPVFWLYNMGDDHRSSGEWEIDMAELSGRPVTLNLPPAGNIPANRAAYMNTHGEASPSFNTFYDMGYTLSSGFHAFGFEWDSSNTIRWYHNRVLKGTQTNAVFKQCLLMFTMDLSRGPPNGPAYEGNKIGSDGKTQIDCDIDYIGVWKL